MISPDLHYLVFSIKVPSYCQDLCVKKKKKEESLTSKNIKVQNI